MTYHPTATNLNKYQWDRVQNPLDRGYHDAGDAGMNINDNFIIKSFVESIKDANINSNDEFSFFSSGSFFSEEVELENGNAYWLRLEQPNILQTDFSKLYSQKINFSHPIRTWEIDSVTFEFSGSFLNPVELTVLGGDVEKLEKYMFGTYEEDSTLRGDPIPNPVVTVTNNQYRGFHGCVRTGTNNCRQAYTDNDMQYPGKNKTHDGIDITADVGVSVHALRGGTVVGVVNTYKRRNDEYEDLNDFDADGNASDNANCGCDYGGGYGNYVIIQTILDEPIEKINGTTTNTVYVRYAHLDTVYSTSGQVNEGQIIGLSGCSGNAASYNVSQKHLYHIHIEADDEQTCTGVRMIDPLKLMSSDIRKPEEEE